MIAKVMLAFGIILLVMVGWITVQQMAKRFARQHPEWGPYREKVGNCGGNCKCEGGDTCQKE